MLTNKSFLYVTVVVAAILFVLVLALSKDAGAHFFGWFHAHATRCVLPDSFNDWDLLPDGVCPLVVPLYIGDNCSCSAAPNYLGIAQ